MAGDNGDWNPLAIELVRMNENAPRVPIAVDRRNSMEYQRAVLHVMHCQKNKPLKRNLYLRWLRFKYTYREYFVEETFDTAVTFKYTILQHLVRNGDLRVEWAGLVCELKNTSEMSTKQAMALIFVHENLLKNKRLVVAESQQEQIPLDGDLQIYRAPTARADQATNGYQLITSPMKSPIKAHSPRKQNPDEDQPCCSKDLDWNDTATKIIQDSMGPARQIPARSRRSFSASPAKIKVMPAEQRRRRSPRKCVEVTEPVEEVLDHHEDDTASCNTDTTDGSVEVPAPVARKRRGRPPKALVLPIAKVDEKDLSPTASDTSSSAASFDSINASAPNQPSVAENIPKASFNARHPIGEKTTRSLRSETDDLPVLELPPLRRNKPKVEKVEETVVQSTIVVKEDERKVLPPSKPRRVRKEISEERTANLSDDHHDTGVSTETASSRRSSRTRRSITYTFALLDTTLLQELASPVKQAPSVEDVQPPKRGRGRPPKKPLLNLATSTTTKNMEAAKIEAPMMVKPNAEAQPEDAAQPVSARISPRKKAVNDAEAKATERTRTPPRKAKQVIGLSDIVKPIADKEAPKSPVKPVVLPKSVSPARIQKTLETAAPAPLPKLGKREAEKVPDSIVQPKKRRVGRPRKYPLVVPSFAVQPPPSAVVEAEATANDIDAPFKKRRKTRRMTAIATEYAKVTVVHDEPQPDLKSILIVSNKEQLAREENSDDGSGVENTSSRSSRKVRFTVVEHDEGTFYGRTSAVGAK